MSVLAVTHVATGREKGGRVKVTSRVFSFFFWNALAGTRQGTGLEK